VQGVWRWCVWLAVDTLVGLPDDFETRPEKAVSGIESCVELFVINLFNGVITRANFLFGCCS
jgi:hypothetical protein